VPVCLVPARLPRDPERAAAYIGFLMARHEPDNLTGRRTIIGWRKYQQPNAVLLNAFIEYGCKM
jgi:hypothetical protein